MIYSTKDIFIQRRTSAGTFEEYPLIVHPNSVIMTDSANDLIMVTTSSLLLMSSAESASVSISSSYALTASVALNGGGSGTSLVTGSTYPITSSCAESASWATRAITASYFTSSQVQIIDGQLKLYNITTGTYYVIVVSGSVGEETLQIGI